MSWYAPFCSSKLCSLILEMICRCVETSVAPPRQAWFSASASEPLPPFASTMRNGKTMPLTTSSRVEYRLLNLSRTGDWISLVRIRIRNLVVVWTFLATSPILWQALSRSLYRASGVAAFLRSPDLQMSICHRRRNLGPDCRRLILTRRLRFR